jgi:hypothetical protein
LQQSLHEGSNALYVEVSLYAKEQCVEEDVQSPLVYFTQTSQRRNVLVQVPVKPIWDLPVSVVHLEEEAQGLDLQDRVAPEVSELVEGVQLLGEEGVVEHCAFTVEGEDLVDSLEEEGEGFAVDFVGAISGKSLR